MLIELLGAFVAGVAVLGVALLLNRFVFRGRLERWVLPASAAAGMLGFTLWAEYSWPARALAVQPGLHMASANSVSPFYKPWTWIWPLSTRIVAISGATTHTHPQQPGLVLTQVVLLARWEQLRAFPMVFDCEASRGIQLVDGVELNPDGTLEGADWTQMAADDPVLRTACAVREEESNERGSGT